MTAVPPSMKSLKPYLQHAKQTQKVDPLIAYFCKYYAATLGIGQNPTEPEDKQFLLSLLDELEAEKPVLKDRLSDPSSHAPYVTQFATKIFNKADAEDRAGKATKATARTFYASTIFFNTLRQFGELEPEVQEMLKYAKWKAADITTALKEGRKPLPGPAMSEEEQQELQSELDALENPSINNGSYTQGVSQENYASPAVNESHEFQPNQMNFVPPKGATSNGEFNSVSNGDKYSFDEPVRNQGMGSTHYGSFTSEPPAYNHSQMQSQSPIFGKQFMNTQTEEVTASDFPATPTVSYDFSSATNSAPTQNMSSSFQPQSQWYPKGDTPDLPRKEEDLPQASPTYQVPVQYYQPQESISHDIQPTVQVPNNTGPPFQGQFSGQASQTQYSQVQPSFQPASRPNPVRMNRQTPPIQYPERPSFDQAYKYARFSVSALQFEDVPTAILNLKRSLAQLGIRVE